MNDAKVSFLHVSQNIPTDSPMEVMMRNPVNSQIHVSQVIYCSVRPRIDDDGNIFDNDNDGEDCNNINNYYDNNKHNVYNDINSNNYNNRIENDNLSVTSFIVNNRNINFAMYIYKDAFFMIKTMIMVIIILIRQCLDAAVSHGK